ncbi:MULTISPECIES: helix-turn-helix transcriptional regulator [unclassified Selenomonas]|uniref:helix-turn-helix domain-containing protein n=1 Tax=unclassified Selenomonas TaxID=2637378 RepID=UPI0006905234|nr:MULTISPECIES: helix-turn-helix transcriptional regulator [unclassified Selenomonas]MBQ1868802.1 helix-turn-helix transcriptional regulator [Selenomonas sp.]
MTVHNKNLTGQEPFNIRLHRLREEHRLTQSEVASACEVTATVYGNWEQGRSLPSIDRLPVLAQVFHTTTDYLLGVKAEDAAEVLLSRIRQLDENEKNAIEQVIASMLGHNSRKK